MSARRLRVSPTPEVLFRISVSQRPGVSIGIAHTAVRIDPTDGSRPECPAMALGLESWETGRASVTYRTVVDPRQIPSLIGGLKINNNERAEHVYASEPKDS